MLVVSDVPPFRGYVHPGDVHVPPVDEVPLGQGVQHAGVDGVPVDNLHLGEPYPLLEPGGRRDARHHHQLDQLSTFCSEFAALRLF